MKASRTSGLLFTSREVGRTILQARDLVNKNCCSEIALFTPFVLTGFFCDSDVTPIVDTK